MSELPPSWAELSLVEACKKITDGTHHSPPNTATGEFKYVTAKNIRRHGLDLADLTYVSAEVHRGIYERCPVEQGDVLYIKDGATTGLAINNTLDEPFSLLSSVALLKPDRRLLDERYLRHWLNSPETLASMIGQMSGSAIKRLTLTTISRQRLPLPPVAEQRRIVTKLDALTARTARARADLDRIPALAERYKQAVLAKAFSGELTGEIYAAEFSPVSFSSVLESTFYGPRFNKEAYCEVGVPTLRTTDFDDAGRVVPKSPPQVSVSGKELEKWGLRDGDLLVTRTGSIGKCAVYEASMGPALPSAYLIRTRLRLTRIAPRFALLFLLSPSGQEQLGLGITAVTQPNINAGVIERLRLPVPSLKTQAEVVAKVDSMFAEIDRLTAEAAAARRLLDRLDQAILAKAFRGELVLQDPADEPASVLLERIRAERAAAPKPKRGRRKAAA